MLISRAAARYPAFSGQTLNRRAPDKGRKRKKPALSYLLSSTFYKGKGRYCKLCIHYCLLCIARPELSQWARVVLLKCFQSEVT